MILCFLCGFSSNDSFYDMNVIELLNMVFEIIEKVSFNIASEASYVYIRSLKMPKIVYFG